MEGTNPLDFWFDTDCKKVRFIWVNFTSCEIQSNVPSIPKNARLTTKMLALIFEFALQLVVEVLVELGLVSLTEPFQRKPNPLLSAIGYGCIGAILGGVSLAVFPNNFVAQSLRLANLLLTPIAVGIAMTAVGYWRSSRGDPVLRIDKFFYGYLFALALALVRFYWAE
jgi:hypothetical protein